MAKDVRIVPSTGIIEFKNEGISVGSITESGGNIYISTSGYVSFGDGTPANLEIGAINQSVDFTFLGGGSITAGGNTINVGVSGDTVNLAVPGVTYQYPTNLNAASLQGYVASDFAIANHFHTIANITGLQSALDGKQAAGSYLTTTGKAADSNLLDGIDSSSFLRSDTSDTFTGSLTINGDIRGAGQQLVLNAGESYAYASGQTDEYVYVNAEQGLMVTTTPDNWSSYWAGRQTTIITGTSISVNGSTVWHTGNFNPASYLGVSAKAADSNLLDGIDSSSFMRSDANDSFTAIPTFAKGSSGALAARTGYSDFLGYNPTYGSYIGGGVGNAIGYLYAGGYFHDGTNVRTLYHTGNFTDNSTNWNTAYSWGNHAGLYAAASHNHAGVYDNYGSWNLKTNGTQRTTVASSGTLDITAGTNVTVSYGAGGVVTISSTDTNTTYTASTGLTLSGTAFSVASNGISATQLNVSGNGTTAQYLRSDGDGSFTWATPPDTNTTYSAGTGLTLSGTTFSVTSGTYAASTHQHDASEIVSGQFATQLIPDLSGTYALASHTHSYLPLSGGTITGVIDTGTSNTSAFRFGGRSFSWNSAMQTPNSNVPHIMQNTYAGWDPVLGIKTTNGFWQMGAYSGDEIHFGYMAGAFGSHSTNGFDYSYSVTPTTFKIGNVGTMNLTVSGTITASGYNKSNWDTAYGWGNHSGLYLGISATAADSNKLGGIAASSYAQLSSPSLTGTPTAPTAGAGTNTTQIATTAFVQTAVSNLVASAPAALDTLNELAAALGNDANFSTTVSTNIGTKVSKTGDTMTGNLNMSGNNKVVLGPNSTWGKYLSIGGNANNSDANTASIGITNGNLHLDAAQGGFATYLNYYDGTAGVAFGSGASGVVAWMGSDGDLWKGSSDNTGNKYWHAGDFANNSNNWNTAYSWGNHSGLYLGASAKAADSNLLDGIDSSSFLRSDADDSFSDATKTLTIAGVVRSTNNGNVYGPNFNVSTTNKDTAEYAYRVDRSGTVVGGITIGGQGKFADGLSVGTASFTAATISNWNTAYGWGNHASAGYLTSLPAHTHSEYLKYNPDGDGIAISYDDSNPTINGVSIGGGHWFGADGNTAGGYLAAKVLHAEGITSSISGYYVGSMNISAGGNSTAVIDGSGNWVGVSIPDNKIASSGNWNTAYGWGNHSGLYLGNSGQQQLQKTAHAPGTSAYHLELYSPDTGDSNNEVSMRFHQGNRYWGQLRYRNGAFRITGGADDTVGTMYANIVGNVTGTVTGNASTSTTLQTARTLTIGNTGKSFNGSAAVSWTLAEIGAQAAGSYAAASHNHDSSYVNVTGDSMSGILTMGANIEPSTDRGYDLGRDDARWRIVYCETLDSAGLHEANLASSKTGFHATGTVLVWKDGEAVPCTDFADYMKIGIAVYGNPSPLVQGAEPVLCTGQVREGDYLVTSQTEGHAVAMSRKEVKEQDIMDCVIGKALESGNGESHLIKTWVNI